MKIFGKRVDSVWIWTLIGLGFYLWPLMQTSVLPGKPGDVYFYLWQAGWFCPNFFRDNFWVGSVFAPNGVNYAGGYVAPMLYALVCPFYGWGPRVMIKVMWALQVAMVVLVSNWVAGKYLTNRWLKVSFVFLYAFCGFYLVRVYEHVDLLALVWASALVYALMDKMDWLNRKQVVLVAAAVAVGMVSAWQNIANLTFLVVIMGAARMRSIRWAKDNWREVVVNMGIGMVVFGVVFLPLGWPMVRYNLSGLKQAPPINQPTMNMNLIGGVVPANEWRGKFGPLLKRLDANVSGLEVTNPVDLVVLGIGLVGVAYVGTRKKLRLMSKEVVILGVYGMLSFGGNLSIGGGKGLALFYYQWLEKVPPLSVTRTPARLWVMVVFVITLWSLVWLERVMGQKRWRGWLERGAKVLAAYSVVSTTILAGNVQIPVFDDVRLFPMKALMEIRQAPADERVLDVPLAVGVYPVLSYLQVTHGHPMISGYVPYTVKTKEALATIDGDEVLRQLECEGTSYAPQGELRDGIPTDEFGEAMKRNGIGYVILHQTLLGYPECGRVRGVVEGVLSGGGLVKMGEGGGFGVYKVKDTQEK